MPLSPPAPSGGKKSRCITSLLTIIFILKFCGYSVSLVWSCVSFWLLCCDVCNVCSCPTLGRLSEPQNPLYGPGCWATSATRLFETFCNQPLFLMASVLASQQQWKSIPESRTELEGEGRGVYLVRGWCDLRWFIPALLTLPHFSWILLPSPKAPSLITVINYYRLNVCVLPTFLIWNPPPQGDGIRRWGLWKIPISWE